MQTNIEIIFNRLINLYGIPKYKEVFLNRE
jgi:vacuolar-type H+-ATPase subunit I/STV1